MKRLTVFFDANILISAFAVKGLCSELLEKARRKQINGITSEHVLAEAQKNFQKKLKLPLQSACENIQIIRDALDVMNDQPMHAQAKGACPFDPGDEKVLSDALHSGAHVLVTGDKDFLGVLKTGNLKLLSPRELLLQLGNRDRFNE